MLVPQDRRRRLCRIGTTKPAQRTLLMIVLKPILDVVVPSQLVDASERLCVCRTLFHFIHLTIFFVFCLYLTPVHIASDDSVEKIYISVYSYFFLQFFVFATWKGNLLGLGNARLASLLSPVDHRSRFLNYKKKKMMTGIES